MIDGYYRKTAIIVGVLFIIATAASLVASSLLNPVVNATDYLTSVSANANQLIAGVLFDLVAALSVVLIAAMMFPILKRFHEGIAAGYLGLRTIEAVIFIPNIICTLLLLTLSREYVSAGASASSSFQTSGTLLLGVREWVFPLNPIIAGTGMLLFYYLLYQSRLIPRWLSLWGLLGGTLVMVAGLNGLFGDFPFLLAVPIAVQEMVFALWLIVRGFNPSKATKGGVTP
jgi:Domain of unknown function (DUF4386)